MSRRIRNDTPLLQDAEPITPALLAAGLTDEQARLALKTIIGAGYFVAPREPTNSMLLAYLHSYGQVATNPATTVTSLAKARQRWKAMGEAGTHVAMSVKRMKAPMSVVAAGSRGGKVGGLARAAALSPERRSEIARAAARKRWNKD
jgi:protein-disulfide isomerase-like protein with CxxC motif